MRIGVALLPIIALLAGCGGASRETLEVPFHEDFADCQRFTLSDDVATVDCPDGELRIVVSQPEVSGTHFVPFRFGTEQRALDVSATARAPVAGGAWGVGCLGSELDEGTSGYLFVLSSLGNAALFRLRPAHGAEESGGRVPQEFLLLRERDHAVRNAPARHDLGIRCTRVAGTGAVRVEATVDGENALAASDRSDGVAPFTAAVSSVLTGKPGTDVRFDDVRVSGVEAGEPPVNDQDARIALVKAAAAKKTGYGGVGSVFCQEVNSSCVVTYLLDGFPACQFWYVESTNGVLVAMTDEEPAQGLEAEYDADYDPDAVGCRRP